MSGLWVGLGTAAVGAWGSHQQAKAANAPKKAWTDQTTEQSPYFAGQMNPDIEEVLKYQRGLIQQGAPTLDKHGNVTYGAIPQGTRPGPIDSWTPADDPRMPKGNPGLGLGGRQDGGPQDDGDLGQYKPIASPSSAKSGAGKGKGAGGGGKKKATGPPITTSAPTPTGPNLSTPQGIFTEVAKRGLDAGNTETIGGARNLMSNIWGAAGTPGGSTQAGAGAERTGFEGYNPILDRQAQRLESGADSRVGRDLILGFLNENKRAGGAAPTDSRSALNFGAAGSGTGAGVGVPAQQSSSAPASQVSPARAARGLVNQDWMARNNPQPVPDDAASATDPDDMQALPSQSGPPDTTPIYGRPAGPNDVPDTLAVQSFFGDETRKMMDEQANESELQALIDAMAADVQRGTFRERAALDAAASGSGRFGGSTWAAQNRDLSEEAAQELLKSSSAIRVGDRDARRNARLAALSGVNQRDLGLLGANVQREGIAANERASANASASSAAAQEAQMALAQRGQDLAAISDLLGYEQFEMGQLGDIGGQLSGDRLGSLGMVPGLEGIGLAGLDATLGAGGGMVDMRGQDVQRGIANQQAGIARQGLNQQLGMYNAGQQQNAVNNYLGTLMNIGQMGGTSRTQGQNVQPGLGVSTGAAALQGGVGGFLAGYGAYKQYR